MDGLKNIPKQYLVFGGVIILLIGIIGYMMVGSGSLQTAADKEDSVFKEPNEVIPTVDSSVQATITGNKEGVIEIKGIPKGTKEIEYELSYNTESGSIEGVFGTIEVKSGDSVEEDIIFGTSSSGVNRYHKIDGPVKGTFKFTGSYGQRILEKEFKV